MLRRIGKKLVINFLIYSGIIKMIRFLFQRNQVTILLLHDPPVAEFESLMFSLKQRYNFVSLEKFTECKKNNNLSLLPKYSAILTFDDGHKNNYNLLKVINKMEIPSTFFVCSDIVNTNRHFWSNYNIPKEKLNDIKALSNHKMLDYLRTLGYEKKKAYSERHALNLKEMVEMNTSKFVTFQSHTMFHPILTNVEDEESKLEIYQSKMNLEELLKKEISMFAYPNGNYTDREIAYIKESGYEFALTVDNGFNSIKTNNFKLKRICLNDFGSIKENTVKATGIWKYIFK